MQHGTTEESTGLPQLSHAASLPFIPHLCLLWSRDEPARIGETCAVSRSMTLGRGGHERGDPVAEFARQRPGQNLPTGRLESARLSREQWRLEPSRSRVEVHNKGKRRLLHNGVACDHAVAEEGDVLYVEGVAMFLVDSRPKLLPGDERTASLGFEFGKPDADGRVGESLATWQLRRQLDLLARSGCHALIRGPSGSGKEACARALHRLSGKSAAKFVARNAATIPQSLVDAELFGSARDYPNAGQPARPGLVGAADGGTLFLDEIGQLPEVQQAALLRVLDAGEYQRLGDAQPRVSTLRLIAATNQELSALKHDLLARLSGRVEVPPLSLRRSDIPLLIQDMLPRLARERATEREGGLELHPDLLAGLVRHEYTHHYRELERLVRLAMQSGRGRSLELTPEVQAELNVADDAIETSDLPEQAIRAALERTGSVSSAAKELGLRSRYALYRIMKKHGINAP